MRVKGFWIEEAWKWIDSEERESLNFDRKSLKLDLQDRYSQHHYFWCENRHTITFDKLSGNPSINSITHTKHQLYWGRWCWAKRWSFVFHVYLSLASVLKALVMRESFMITLNVCFSYVTHLPILVCRQTMPRGLELLHEIIPTIASPITLGKSNKEISNLTRIGFGKVRYWTRKIIDSGGENPPHHKSCSGRPCNITYRILKLIPTQVEAEPCVIAIKIKEKNPLLLRRVNIHMIQSSLKDGLSYEHKPALTNIWYMFTKKPHFCSW